ncbi:MAG TPA: Hsp70 family protein [Candidatus Bathyarchaeia archaeon]|nr:Hsp70 family protein [Candidatus Bathyarchaeia archaeon]
MSSRSRYVVGIDLGTTNSAVAFAEPDGDREIASFAIPQLVAPGDLQARPALPSALYVAGAHDVAEGELALPWRADERYVVGVLARRLGERIAGRLITSAKSWLCHGGVDRSAAILPWGAPPEVAKLSPVAASARYLEHIRDAWNAARPEAPLAAQEVILTVPASFDEVARELTVEAARRAGLERVRLLEEPQAAMYAWLAQRKDWRALLEDHRLVLVVDVGGGTTDFSLIAVHHAPAGLTLERMQVGDHLLLGGDNMDLAIARLVESRKPSTERLDAARWQQLTALCREAKERLLGEAPPASVAVTVTGRGRGVIQGTVAASLGRAEIESVVIEGFFPAAAADARPGSEQDVGLAEFGLPFVSDPAITRHLAAFLALGDAGDRRVVPDAVLFNGGALTPRAVRERILETLAVWGGTRPFELVGTDLELAVARGAAAYGLALRGIGVRVAGGAARAYYVGLAAQAATAGKDPGAGRRLLCIAPRGMLEGDTIDLSGSELEVVANVPVQFPVYASSTRTGDAGGAIVDVDPGSLAPMPAVETVLRFGRSLAERTIPVHLRSHLSETGTLELWCLSNRTDHRWRLNFDLRAREAVGVRSEPERAAEEAATADPAGAQGLVLGAERLEAALHLVEASFAPAATGDPVGLTRALEEALGAGKDAWPLAEIRVLWDRLFALEAGRTRSPGHEARWLNLAGFTLRPGFGEARDSWRVEQLWRLFDRGLVFPGAVQVRAEWWTLWKRAAGGLTRAQQQGLHGEIRAILLGGPVKSVKSARWKGGPQELREMWQTAASLERLPAGVKRELATELARRVLRRKASDAEIWSFGRLAARSLVYGPANTVIEPQVVEPWLTALADAPWERPAATALAVTQIARLTGDRARDVSSELRAKLATRLDALAEGRRLARSLRALVALETRDQARVLAESLPIGLRLREDLSAGEVGGAGGPGQDP